MAENAHGATKISVGTPVVALDGTPLGKVREVYPHYLLVSEDGGHEDLQIPIHAITGLDNGKLRVSVNRRALSQVDDVETTHRLSREQGS
jgi:hypothetical protein